MKLFASNFSLCIFVRKLSGYRVSPPVVNDTQANRLKERKIYVMDNQIFKYTMEIICFKRINNKNGAQVYKSVIIDSFTKKIGTSLKALVRKKMF